MHEAAIALNVLDRIRELVAEHGARAARAVHLDVGRLSGVDPDALDLAMRAATHDAGLRDLTWTLAAVPAAVQCRGCGMTTEPDSLFPVCGNCASTDVDVVRGRELQIGRIELEMNHV